MATEVKDTEIESACLDWINQTFELDGLGPCESFASLSDGVVLGQMFAAIAPDSFDPSAIQATDNYVLKGSNLRLLLRSIESYYNEVLGKGVDLRSVDVNAIARTSDHDEIVGLLEVVLGAAMQCDDKAVFIQAIFTLGEVAQLVLKGMVERAMARMYSLEGGEAVEEEHEDASSHMAGGTEELLRARELIRELQDEKQRHLSSALELESSNQALQEQCDRLERQVSDFSAEKARSDGSDRSRVAAAEQVSAQLQLDLDDTKRELDLKIVENEGMGSELSGMRKQLGSVNELKAKAELEAQLMADELDVAKDRISKVTKLEATLEKYQTKLEELSTIKKHNKELESQVDKYLDQIEELEGNNKGMSALSKMLDQYKDKNVELEREKLEALSMLSLKEDELAQKQSSLSEAVMARRQAANELAAARSEWEAQAEAAVAAAPPPGMDVPLPDGETVSSLLDKLKQMETDLRRERREKEVERAGHQMAEAEALTLLRAELDTERASSREREEELLQTRKEMAAVKAELERANEAAESALRRHNAEVEGEQRRVATEAETRYEALSDENRSITQQISVKTNTIRLLEERLKEKEGLVNKLQQDKGKLEAFAKNSLSSFKDKYLKELTKFRNEKKEWKDKFTVLSKKYDKDQETYRREERLLLSSMYEIGMRIMDRNMKAMQDTSPSSSSFLATQRANNNS
jgi:DNA repair exonuclease SbcCD ATPase subunit